MQIIIIDSAEALAEDIRKEYIKNPLVNVKQAVLSCLHPIEVPDSAEALVDKVRDTMLDDEDCYVLTDSEAAALIESHGKRVPRTEIIDAYESGYSRGENDAVESLGRNAKQAAEEYADKYGYRAE